MIWNSAFYLEFKPHQIDKQVLTNHRDIVVVDKDQKAVVVIDVALPSDSNIKKNEYEKLGKQQSLEKELERIWKVKAKMVPVVEALRAVTPKLGGWLQTNPRNIIRELDSWSRRVQC